MRQNGTTSDVTQYAWLTEDGKVGLIFDAEDYILIYVDLTATSNVQAMNNDLMKEFSAKYKKRVQTKHQVYKFIKK